MPATGEQQAYVAPGRNNKELLQVVKQLQVVKELGAEIVDPRGNVSALGARRASFVTRAPPVAF
jgi:hypothetical protein